MKLNIQHENKKLRSWQQWLWRQ